MLQIDNVYAGYDRTNILQGVSMNIKQGEIVSIVGANGAGKTTLFRAISGILTPNDGHVRFQDRTLNRMKPHEIVRLGIGQVPEGRQVVPSLSVIDHLQLSGHYGGRASAAEIQSRLEHIFELFPILYERQTQAAGTLSGGQQQMLVIGRALMMQPKLLLLDEPSLGLAPIIVSQILESLVEINREGMTILLIEQNAFAALKISHRAYVMEHGKIVMENTGEALLNDESLKSFYLG